MGASRAVFSQPGLQMVCGGKRSRQRVLTSARMPMRLTTGWYLSHVFLCYPMAERVCGTSAVTGCLVMRRQHSTSCRLRARRAIAQRLLCRLYIKLMLWESDNGTQRHSVPSLSGLMLTPLLPTRRQAPTACDPEVIASLPSRGDAQAMHAGPAAAEAATATIPSGVALSSSPRDEPSPPR